MTTYQEAPLKHAIKEIERLIEQQIAAASAAIYLQAREYDTHYEVRDILGHASITQTERYSHLAQENLAVAIGRLQ